MARMTPGLNFTRREHAQGRRQRDGRAAQVQARWTTSSRADVVEQVEPLKKLLETRDKLRDLLTKVDRSDDLESLLEQVLQNTDELKKLQAELGGQDPTARPERRCNHEHRRTSTSRGAGRRDRPPRRRSLLDEVLDAPPSRPNAIAGRGADRRP